MQKIHADKIALCEAIKELGDRAPKYTEDLLKTMKVTNERLQKLHHGLVEASSTSDGQAFDDLWEKHVCLLDPTNDEYLGKDIDVSRSRCNEHDSMVSGQPAKKVIKYKNNLDKACKLA